MSNRFISIVSNALDFFDATTFTDVFSVLGAAFVDELLLFARFALDVRHTVDHVFIDLREFGSALLLVTRKTITTDKSGLIIATFSSQHFINDEIFISFADRKFRSLQVARDDFGIDAALGVTSVLDATVLSRSPRVTRQVVLIAFNAARAFLRINTSALVFNHTLRAVTTFTGHFNGTFSQ